MTRCPSCRVPAASVATIGHCGHDDCRGWVEGFEAAIRLFWQAVCEGFATEHKQEAEKAWRRCERTSDPYWSREMVRQEARAAQYRAWAGEA